MDQKLQKAEQTIEQNLPTIMHAASAAYWMSNLFVAIEERNPTKLFHVGIGLLGHYVATQIEKQSESQAQCGTAMPM